MDIPAAAKSAIKESLACEFIGFTLATTLYGITVLQGYFYYRQYLHDTLRLKVLVAVVLAADTLTTLMMAHAIYTYVVLDFGEPLKIDLITWSFSSENGFAVLTAFIVQCYFGQRLWIFSRKNVVFVGLLFFMAFFALGTGLAVTIRTFIEPTWAALGTVTSRILLGLYSGASSVCDALIAAGLCYYLQTNRSGLRKTDTIVDKLMVYAIERGLLTTTCQVMHMILTVALPGRPIFLPFAMLESKMYANALLATLNVRKSLTDGKGPIELGRSHSFGTLSPVPGETTGGRATFGNDSALKNSVGTASVATIKFGSKTLQDNDEESMMTKAAGRMV
ncbi:hypothetical protein C8Q78DRAFT_1077627 [Trametes maxima]|nr:hypothetical protein C8Q78DRAFT_1077627 [Trametes maxima]